MGSDRAMNGAYLVLALAVILSASGQYAHAQEADPDVEAPPDPSLFTLHIPDKMMINTPYEGVLIREGTDGSIIVHMASTDASVEIPSSVIIRDGYNHAIFPINATDGASSDIVSAEITVSAVTEGRTETATAYTYSGGGFGSKITLAGPTGADGTVRTATDRIPLYVYLTDPYGIPVAAASDVEVSLTTSGGVRLISDAGDRRNDITVTIPAGSSSVLRSAITEADGSIYGAADGLQTDTLEVDYHDIDPPRVRIGVAPQVAMPNSYVHYYVWIEYDGTQYIPNDVIDVQVSISDRSSARLELAIADGGSGGASDKTVWMVDGIARGVAYTGDPDDSDYDPASDVTISASIDGFGSDSAPIWIGPYISGGGDVDEIHEEADACRAEDEPAEGCDFLVDASDALNSGGRAPVNSARLWLFPDSPRVSAYGVVGTYHEVADVTVDVEAEDVDGGTFTVTRSEDRTVLIPVRMSPRAEFDVSGSPGLSHDGAVGALVSAGRGDRLDSVHDLIIQRDTQNVAQSSAEFAVTALVHGSHHVSVHGSDVGDPPTVEFETAGLHGGMQILVTELPSRIGEYGDIALVSVTDGDGYLVDPDGVADRVGILQEGGSISDLGILAESHPVRDGRGGPDWAGSSARVAGVHGEEYAYVTTQVPGLGAARSMISPSGIPSGISVWAPSSVHMSEEFPVVIHAINEEGVPLAVLNDVTISTSDVTSSGDGSRFRANVEGKLDVTLISDDTRHITSRVVDVFANSPDGVDISFGDSTVPDDAPVDISDGIDSIFRLGEGIVLNIVTAGIIDPSIIIDAAGLHFEEDGGVWTANPAIPGTHDVVVTVSADGWDTHTASYRVGVIDLIDVSYEASTDDGLQVHTSVGLSPVWLEDEAYEIDSGYGMTLQPGIYQASVPQTIEVGEGHVYTLEGMEISGRPVQYAETFSVTLDSDALVQADYQRRIDVRFDNYYDSESIESSETAGSGKYRYGDTVTLEADIQYESGGLIWHVPSEWVGLPEGAALAGDMSSARFEAVEGAEGYVEYERSYMPVIAVAAAAGIAVPVLLFRASPDILHDIRDVFSRLASRIPAPSVGRRGKAKAGAAGARREQEAGGQ